MGGGNTLNNSAMAPAMNSVDIQNQMGLMH